GIGIADALDVAHGSGVLHRDLKPANLFVTSRGQVKILDFGVAKFDADADAAVSTDAQTAPITGAGTTMGTIAYMSPEQSRGEPAAAGSVLFSFGTALYERASGRRAFAGPTTAVIFDKILNRAPVPLRHVGPDFPLDLERIISRCLEK